LKCESEGPMMGGGRLQKLVAPLIGGAMAEIPDLDQGGRQRLHVRVRSKYFEEDQSFLYLVEIELQQKVTEEQTQRDWWPSTEKWMAWGTAPSEAEVRKHIIDMMNSKVNAWKAE
ncbi:MAG: hypothetical protein ABL878_00420, partial [Burkholderiales bacterium]